MGSETAPPTYCGETSLAAVLPAPLFLRSKESMDDDLLSAITFYAAQLSDANQQIILAKAMLLLEAQRQNINWED